MYHIWKARYSSRFSGSMSSRFLLSFLVTHLTHCVTGDIPYYATRCHLRGRLDFTIRLSSSAHIVKIIEENALFPCEPFIPQPTPIPYRINVNLPIYDSLPSGTTARTSTSGGSEWSPSISETHEHPFVLKKKATLRSGQTSTRSSQRSPPSYRSSTLSNSILFPPPEEAEQPSEEPHPQDHTKLSTAWDAMLAGRFLAPNILTILPFYLSSCFEDVRSHPPMQILLPPNSFRNFGTLSNFSFDSETQPLELTRYSSQASDESAVMLPTATDSLHLSKVVMTVRSCKEAIWTEYQKLFPAESPLVTSSARPKDALSLSYMSKSSAREAFDKAWSNWEG